MSNLKNETAARLVSTDSRFFIGWTWISQSRDCTVGLCYEGGTEEAVAAYFASRSYYEQARLRCFTLAAPDAEPVEHTFGA